MRSPSVTRWRRAARFASWMVFALLLAIGAAGWLTARKAIESFQVVDLTNRTIDAVHGVRLSVAVGRTELRNVVLTNDSVALKALRRAFDSSRVTATRLRSLATDKDSERVRAVALEASLQELDSAQLRTARSRANGLDAAAAMLASPGVSRARERVLALLDTIERIERAQLRDRAVAFEFAADRLLAVFVTALLAASLLIVLAAALRRRDARAMKSAATQYREMAERNPDAIFVQQRGLIRYANAAAAAILGMESGEALVGRPFFDWIHPDERPQALELANAVFTADAVIDPTTRRFVDAQGREVETEVRAARILFEGEFAAQLVVRDLRLRREAERKLAESEQRYRVLVNAMEEGVVLYDASRNPQFWNPAALGILGRTADELSGVMADDPRWRATDSTGRSLSADEHCSSIAAATGQSSSAIQGLERGDGTRVWVKVNAVPLLDHTGAVHEVEVTFGDITALIDTSHRLEESEARFRILAEQSSDLVSQRSLDHRFEYVSPSHALVLGWTPQEMIGTSAFDYLHPDDASRTRENLSAVEAGSSDPIVARVAHKDGHFVTLESVVTPILRADGTTSGYQVSARDVSARLALEERLRQAEKMEAVERIATNVAHDFNNLLGVVRTSADLLGDPDADDDARGALLTDITLATERAAALTAQLLTFAQRRHVEPTSTDVVDVLRNSIPLLDRLTGPTIALQLEVSQETEAVSVKAEPGQLEQVLYNLILNARDAMPSGGLVRVRAELRDFRDAQAHRHGIIDAGEYVAISVSDNGIGMSDAVYARVFDPFFTTKHVGQGSGLGLPSVLGIVEQAGGAVAAQSIEGLGSSFTVYWPIASKASVRRSPAGTGQPAPSAVPAQPATRERAADPDGDLLLLVDDEAALRRALARTLSLRGYRVLQAATGREALELMRVHGHSVRVLVTDVRMPEMSGFELVETLLGEGFDPPVLFISGQLDAPVPRHWPETVARSFLAKPFPSRELADIIDKLTAVEPARD